MEAAIDNSMDAFAANVREGEKPRTWYRGERVFMRNDEWYIQTREGVDVGPYKCQFDAELELGTLINKLKVTASDRIHNVLRNHASESHNLSIGLNSGAYTNYLVETGGIELLRREGF